MRLYEIFLSGVYAKIEECYDECYLAMSFASALRGMPEFWQLYRSLPMEARMLARKNYRLRSANAFHSSLHFKPIGRPNWSLRVGGHYRAVGKFSGRGVIWEWIGTR